MSEIPSQSERHPVPEIQSERDPVPEIPTTSKRKPRLKIIPRESERDSDAKSDDGQERLPGPSPAKKPRRWITEEEWLNYIKEDPHVRPGSRSDATIFKIPNLLKDTKRKAYVPQMVSLGPYHHGSAELSAMEHYKGRALRTMMTRFNKDLTLDEYDMTFANRARKVILEREDEIRDCYEEDIDCDENTLFMMLCLDGCFILEVLKTLDEGGFELGKINAPNFGENMVAASNIREDISEREPDKINAPIFGENMVFASYILKDILMLENQVPWIVLAVLQHVESSKKHLFNTMVLVTCRLFKIDKENIDQSDQLDWLQSAVQHEKEVPHLLGFLHKAIVHLPSDPSNLNHSISIESRIGGWLQMLPNKNKALNHDFESIPPAVELKNAGIKFRPYKGGIAQICFDPDSSTIYLPQLSVTYDTEVLFRNLIAFEMCRPSVLNYVISYVNLMDDLIDSQKEVAFLRSTGILTNLLGSDQEVADLFNGLFKGVTVSMENVFDGLRKDVNANYKNRIRVQFAELWRDHFSSPWKTIALAVAFAILCLTLLQTIYTVKSTQLRSSPFAVFPSN